MKGPLNDGLTTNTVMFLTILKPTPSFIDNSTLYWVMIPFLPLFDGMDQRRIALLFLVSLEVGGNGSGVAVGTKNDRMN